MFKKPNGSVAPFPSPAPAPSVPEEVLSIPAELTEVAAALLKLHSIHEGIWRVVIEFGPIAAIMGRLTQTGTDKVAMAPMACVPVLRLHLQRCEKADSLTVDAAVVNPRPSIIHKPNFFG